MYTLEELSIDHQYYCSNNNYYSNDAAQTYERWEDFYSEWGDADMDYNLVFRWDIKKNNPDGQQEGDNRTDYYMEVFVIGQRKGLFTPIIIQSIKDENVSEIIQFLKPRLEYLKKLWLPFI